VLVSYVECHPVVGPVRHRKSWPLSPRLEHRSCWVMLRLGHQDAIASAPPHDPSGAWRVWMTLTPTGPNGERTFGSI
jgi:hypothetical protein